MESKALLALPRWIEAYPRATKPSAIIAQVEGSGTAGGRFRQFIGERHGWKHRSEVLAGLQLEQSRRIRKKWPKVSLTVPDMTTVIASGVSRWIDSTVVSVSVNMSVPGPRATTG